MQNLLQKLSVPGEIIYAWVHRGTEPFQRPDSVLDSSIAGFHGDFYSYGMCLWAMLVCDDPQTQLMDTLRAKVGADWFKKSARHQVSQWTGAVTDERHCTLAYCDSSVRLRLQVSTRSSYCVLTAMARVWDPIVLRRGSMWIVTAWHK